MQQRKSILVAGADDVFAILLGQLPESRYELYATEGLAETHQRYTATKPALLVADLDGGGWQLAPLLTQAASDGAAVLGITATQDHRWIPESVSRFVGPTDPLAIGRAVRDLLDERAFPAAGLVRVDVTLEAGLRAKALVLAPELLWLPGGGRFGATRATEIHLDLAGESVSCRAKLVRDTSYGGQQGIGVQLSDATIANHLSALAHLQLMDRHLYRPDATEGWTDSLKRAVDKRRRRWEAELGAHLSRESSEFDHASEASQGGADAPVESASADTMRHLNRRIDQLAHAVESLQGAARPAAGRSLEVAAASQADSHSEALESLEREQAHLKHAIAKLNTTLLELAEQLQRQDERLGILTARLDQLPPGTSDGTAPESPSFSESDARQLEDHQRELEAQTAKTEALSQRFGRLKDLLLELHHGYRQLEAQMTTARGPAAGPKVSKQTHAGPAATKYEPSADSDTRTPTASGATSATRRQRPAPPRYGRRGMAAALRRVTEDD
jgi:uncharacterized coiled-coil protein SlyX